MGLLRFSASSAILCAAVLAACGSHSNDAATGTTGSGGGGGGGAGGATTTSFVPATHPALPQVRNLGGPVLKSPKVQPIAYGSDPGLADIEKFLTELTQTTFWSETTSEYGVGALTILPTIVRTGAAPANLTPATLEQDLATNTTGTSPAWGAADFSTIYLFLIPPGTIIGDASGTGCTDFDGYHTEVNVQGSLSVPYAVGCACPGFDGPKVTDLQERTVAISHELIEAATDPLPNSHAAYGQEDDADIVWTIASGGEVAAMASTNPCVPVVTQEPYFNSVPQLPDTLTVGAGTGISTPGVKIPVGSTKTIDVDLFSDAPTSGPWKVSVSDLNAALSGTKYLELSLDKTSGQNGDTLHLTIKVLKADPQFGMEPFVILSELDGQSNLWMGSVGQ
jgi:hypothetical protein